MIIVLKSLFYQDKSVPNALFFDEKASLKGSDVKPDDGLLVSTLLPVMQYRRVNKT